MGKATKKKQETSKLLHGLQCHKCKEVIVSLSLHDFRGCECRECYIDGGQDKDGYIRVVGDPENYTMVKVRVSTGYGI